MHYECVVKRLATGEIAVSAREAEYLAEVQAGTVDVEVERSIVDICHLDRVLASGQPEGSWVHPEWCSLVGQVTRTGVGVDGIRVGDRVGAIGPVAGRVVVPARECRVLSDGLDTEQAACSALLVALVRRVRQFRIEIGESVLVLGGGLTGHLVAQLSVVAGATLVIGLDPRQKTDDSDPELHGQGPTPIWVGSRDALERELASREIDVLIDVIDDSAQLARVLPRLRTGGRALLLAANDAQAVDFDLYPDIHRRSLRLVGGTLRDGLRQEPSGGTRPVQEAAYIEHLLMERRLDLMSRTSLCVCPPLSVEQILPTAARTSLTVQWKSEEEARRAA